MIQEEESARSKLEGVVADLRKQLSFQTQESREQRLSEEESLLTRYRQLECERNEAMVALDKAKGATARTQLEVEALEMEQAMVAQAADRRVMFTQVNPASVT